MKRINWADLLCWIRLWSIVPLTVLAQLHANTSFLIVYVIAILTDLFDGIIARKMGVASSDGAELDGAVDLTFAFAGLWWLGLLFPQVYRTFWPYFLVVVGSFFVFFIASHAKLGKATMPHLLSGKLAMALFALLLPILLIWGVVGWYVHALWIVAVLSRVEMTVFVLLGRKNMDAKSVLWK